MLCSVVAQAHENLFLKYNYLILQQHEMIWNVMHAVNRWMPNVVGHILPQFLTIIWLTYGRKQRGYFEAH